MAIFNGDLDQVGPYLRELADLCGLRDWTINVLPDPPDSDDYAADIDIRYGTKWANVRFSKDWASDSAESFRSTCVHELIHAHTNPMVWALNNAQSIIGLTAFEVLRGAFHDAHEVAVDAIATEWARHLPLPIEAKKRKKAS